MANLNTDISLTQIAGFLVLHVTQIINAVLIYLFVGLYQCSNDFKII